MTRRERVRRTLALDGGKGDRVPWTAWPHYRDVVGGDAYVRRVLEWWNTYQPDLLKLPFPLMEEAERTIKEYIAAVKVILDYLPSEDGPVVLGTVPGVLAWADAENGGRTIERLRDAPKATHLRLREIAAEGQFCARELIREAGCDGVFVAAHLPDAAGMNAERYAEAFVPLEREVLAGGEVGWCNVVHLHGGPWPEIAARELTEAVPIVSWGDRTGGISLAEMRARLSGEKCLMGGLNEQKIAGYTREQVSAEVSDALAQTAGGQRLIVAPGCTIAAETPDAILDAIAASVQEAMD